MGIMPILFFFACMISSLASARSIATENFVVCKAKGVVRTVHIRSTADGCKTYYSKNGLEAQIGAAKNFKSCIGFLENIKSNLIKADWNCKDHAESTIMHEEKVSSNQ